MFARKKKHLAFKVVFTVLIIGAFSAVFVPFVVPILLASIVAFAMEPLLVRINRSSTICRTNFVVIMMLLLSLVGLVPMGLTGYKIYSKAVEISHTGLEKSDLYKNLIQYKTTLFTYGNQLLKKFGLSSTIHLDEMTNQALADLGKFLMGGTAYMIAVLPDFLLSLFIFFLCLYVFLTQSHVIKRVFLRMDLLQLSETNAFIAILKKTSYTIVVSSLFIGAIQASIVALGGMAFGSWDFLVVFVLTFLFSFVPVIGAAPVAVMLAILNFVQGNNGQALAMIAVAIFAGFIDNVLRPFLVKDEELHPAVSLVSIIGAIIVFGISGLFLGPVLATLSIKVIPIFFKKKGLFEQLDEFHPVATTDAAKTENPTTGSVLII